MALRLSEEFDDDGLDLLSSSKDKSIRRRSSKACDNCRKAKCKCEPSQNTGEPCRNCHLLGLGCTFLGPSRKRGPPKGYIDAIESRLHQLEAILGALIVSSDPRARSLIADLAAGDDLAHSVITRIEGGPFGPKAKADAQDPSAVSSSSNGMGKKSTGGSARRNTVPGSKMSISSPEDPVDLDPYEWQDRLERAITQRNGTSRMSASIMDGIILPPVPPRDQPDQLGPRRLYAVDSNSFPDLPSTANSLANRSLRQLPTASTWTPSTSSGNQRRRLDIDALENDEQRRVRRATSGININDSHDSWSPHSSVSSPASIHRRAPSNASQNAQQSITSTSSIVPDAVDEEDQFTDVDTSRFAENDTASSDLDAMGQLSIDDHKDVRYHGRTSGLHLLASASSMSSVASRSRSSSGFANPSILNQGTNGVSSEENAKHRNGFWQFPRPGVWPPLDSHTVEQSPGEISPWLLNVGEHFGSTQSPRTIPSPGTGLGQAPPQGFGFTPQAGQSFAACIEEKGLAGLGDILPSRDVQENLLSLYFTHVHPVFPIVHKTHFLKVYRDVVDWIRDANGDSQKPPPKPLSLALLFAMLAVASRFTDEGKPSVPPGKMWPAGLGYADRVRQVVYHGKLPSRLSSVQAILLVAYVDVGVGSMAMAWHSIGLACRTALDAGLNRSVDKWHAGASTMVYTPEEKESCRRIWYAVMLMDNYISTYIGRPLSVLDSDYDTPLPDDDTEDMEILYLPARTPTARTPGACVSNSLRYVPAPSRIISCFRSRAILSRILAAVMHKVYSIRPTWSRVAEAANLEARLDKWYYDLPEHLRYDCHSKVPIPAPHILTLHLDYWCTVLLLHRPFIRIKAASKGVKVESDDGLSTATRTSQKAYGICQNAANRLVSIATAYSEVFSLDNLPAFVTFYVFTASIMHVTVLLDNPGDLQSSRALQQAMSILEQMSVVWPSAGRAWDILDGSKASIRHAENFHKEDHPDRRKRAAEDELERRGPSHQHHQHPHPSQTQQHHPQLGHQASQSLHSPSQGPQRSPMTSNPIPYNSFRPPLQLSSHPVAEDSSYTVPSDFTAPESSSLQLNNQSPLPHLSSRFNSYSILASPQSTFPPSQRSQWPLQSSSQEPQSSYSGSADSYLDQARSSSSPFNFSELQQQQSKNQFQPSQLHNSADSVQTAGRGPSDHSFWNEFVSSGDPFADPSTLSTSLYHVPLLPDSQPRNQMPPSIHSHAPSIFQVFDRQGIPLPPQRYQFGNMDPARQGSS